MQSIRGKVAIVTGGAQGIGKAIVEKLSKEGVNVVLADLKVEAAEETLAKLEGKHEFFKCDISKPEDVDQMIKKAEECFGKVDILVNNAAVAIYKFFHEYDFNEWKKVVDVNLNGIFLTSRRCIPLMRKNNGGSIIHISSVHVRTTSTCNSPYVATKGALCSLSRAMSLECAPYHIRVNCILPGAIDTPMLMENWNACAQEDHPLLSRIPLKRFGRPEEIANVVQFLASDASSYITGSEILIDGGLSAHFD